MRPSLAPPAALVPALALLFGCAAGDGRGVDAHHSGPQEVAPGETLVARVFFDGDALGRPRSLGLTGDRLLVGDLPRPHALHVLDAGDGSHLASWGREGQGPGEFLSLRGIEPDADPGRVWLFDASQSRLTHLDVEALLAGGEPLLGSTNLVSDLVPMGVVRIGDSLIVSTGLFSTGRLARFGADGRFRDAIGALPPAPAGVPAAVAQHAYEGTPVASPTRDRVAILTRSADRFEVYGLEDGGVVVHRGPVGFEPVYQMVVSEGRPVMSSGDDLRFGYVDGVAAGANVYALYSGLRRGELPGRANFGGEVHVFDWDGRLLRVHPLDQRVLAIAVTPDERTLDAVRHDPAPAVLQYDLP